MLCQPFGQRSILQTLPMSVSLLCIPHSWLFLIVPDCSSHRWAKGLDLSSSATWNGDPDDNNSNARYKFYTNSKAQELYKDYVRRIIKEFK